MLYKTFSVVRPTRSYIFCSCPCEQLTAHVVTEARRAIYEESIEKTVYRYLQCNKYRADFRAERTLMCWLCPCMFGFILPETRNIWRLDACAQDCLSFLETKLSSTALDSIRDANLDFNFHNGRQLLASLRLNTDWYDRKVQNFFKPKPDHKLVPMDSYY